MNNLLRQLYGRLASASSTCRLVGDVEHWLLRKHRWRPYRAARLGAAGRRSKSFDDWNRARDERPADVERSGLEIDRPRNATSDVAAELVLDRERSVPPRADVALRRPVDLEHGSISAADGDLVDRAVDERAMGRVVGQGSKLDRRVAKNRAGTGTFCAAHEDIGRKACHALEQTGTDGPGTEAAGVERTGAVSDPLRSVRARASTHR